MFIVFFIFCSSTLIFSPYSVKIKVAGVRLPALNAARDALKAAEDRLIAYGLSLAPASVRATLEQGVKQNATIPSVRPPVCYALTVDTSSRYAASITFCRIVAFCFTPCSFANKAKALE